MEELICAGETHEVRRSGRFLIAKLRGAHQVLSTSALSGGQREDIQYLVNHQSCEGKGHDARAALIKGLGEQKYHEHVCKEIGLDPAVVALMGTAANMNYAARAEASYAELHVQAVVTAGVEGNAGCAGDPATWHESPDGWVRAQPYDGTINTMLLFNWPLSPGALAKAVVTMTEGKSAALQELAVSSRYSENLATGTGTDQYCIASPVDAGKKAKCNAGHHAKLGEMIGGAVKQATKEALRWQNGLEPSHTRSLLHALKRYGLTEADVTRSMEARLDEAQAALFRDNIKSVLFEPQVAAAAYAFAAVWDRLRHGTLSQTQASAVLRQQAACMASALAARPDAWFLCYQKLGVCADRPLEAVCDALALGWQMKWR